MTDEQLEKLSRTDFVILIDKKSCPELVTYLMERRLYVSGLVSGEEEPQLNCGWKRQIIVRLKKRVSPRIGAQHLNRLFARSFQSVPELT